MVKVDPNQPAAGSKFKADPLETACVYPCNSLFQRVFFRAAPPIEGATAAPPVCCPSVMSKNHRPFSVKNDVYRFAALIARPFSRRRLSMLRMNRAAS